ncbi:MAG TPA: FAD-dependent oxidoreductase [Actinocrinis sp.]|uniref:FAD-dependent oxidoreductase n=1 Tax=Actinocrinis sp. TaxID=1920516 RepID=UPI002DDD8D3B|nr:FAD-dependent oxidoreductase [Actinocrinis sp.]HEV2343879.1 FAD-dependent oxidoreductase [Actinocrinis sp.]
MNTMRVEVLILGFGKGGKMLAAALGRAGRSVALVEQSGRMYGGTCINIGCVPTKALLHHAETRPATHIAGPWYRRSVGATGELTALMRQKNFATLDAIDAVTIVTGHAAFVDAKSVEVTAGQDRLTISADTIVINTGAKPTVPDLPGLRASRYAVTSTELLDTPELPRRLAIVGGGHAGLEFAGTYSQFGAQVTVLEAHQRILPAEDEDVAAAVAGILHEQGVTLTTGARVTSVSDRVGGAVISYEIDGHAATTDADLILVATGRVPATEGLGLDAAGVRTTPGAAVEVDEYLRTSQPHIYAIGDVTGGPQYTYLSLDDHRIVLDQLQGNSQRTTTNRGPVPYTLFTTPPLARVGLTETQARERGHTVKIASTPINQMNALPRARILNNTHGLMKLVVDATTDHLLGAALLTNDAQETINTLTLAIHHDITATQLRDTIYTHPSTTEGLNETLNNLH